MQSLMPSLLRSPSSSLPSSSRLQASSPSSLPVDPQVSLSQQDQEALKAWMMRWRDKREALGWQANPSQDLGVQILGTLALRYGNVGDVRDVGAVRAANENEKVPSQGHRGWLGWASNLFDRLRGLGGLGGGGIKRERGKGAIVYLWGDVGRGKTQMVDWFLETVPLSQAQKMRQHSHDFFDRIARDRHEVRRVGGIDGGGGVGKRKNSESVRNESSFDGATANGDIDRWIKRYFRQVRLLCLDEVFVRDIAEAMLLERIAKRLYETGVDVVMTSNLPPEELYADGLQRILFMPFIERVVQQGVVMEITAALDYRSLKGARLTASGLAASGLAASGLTVAGKSSSDHASKVHLGAANSMSVVTLENNMPQNLHSAFSKASQSVQPHRTGRDGQEHRDGRGYRDNLVHRGDSVDPIDGVDQRVPSGKTASGETVSSDPTSPSLYRVEPILSRHRAVGEELWHLCAGREGETKVLKLADGRSLPTVRCWEEEDRGWLWLSVATLRADHWSEGVFGRRDWLELSTRFHGLILTELTRMADVDRDLAFRLIEWLDVWYDRGRMLAVVASCHPDELFQMTRTSQAVARACSRLRWMTSAPSAPSAPSAKAPITAMPNSGLSTHGNPYQGMTP